ncbi:MAG: hypothetical protein O6850_00800, partial [Acidobacteria bacterium]|nr:hypothetical protein [Acidobacteriota bacterium]
MKFPVMEAKQLSVGDLISIRSLTEDDILQIYALAERVKAFPQRFSQVLAGRQMAMIFEKPSLRTRVTFEVGITSLGGQAVYMDQTKPRLGEREPIKDVAKNLERWVDCIVARTFQHDAVTQLADAEESLPKEQASLAVANEMLGRRRMELDQLQEKFR